MKATMLGPLDVPATNRSALSFFKTNMRRQQISNTFVSRHVLQLGAFGGSSAQLLERRKKRVSVKGDYSEKDETLHSIYLGCVYLSDTTIVVPDKYTHPSTVIVKHNGDDKPHDYSTL